VYQSSDLTPQNFLCQITTHSIVNDNLPYKNIYNKLRGKYIIKNIPTTFTGYSVFLKVETPEIDFVVEQQLIFTTLTITNEGEKVIEKLPYGLNEVVVDSEGNIIEVSNDFDFFYNKHWIKKNIQIFDERVEWIADNLTQYCKVVTDPTFHERTVPGIFNTGFYAYSDLIEVYSINQLPTGNRIPNDIQTLTDNDLDQYFVEPVYNPLICSLPGIFNLSINKKCLPADGNSVYTSNDEWYYFDTMNIHPINPVFSPYVHYDPQIMVTEIVSGTNIYNPSINAEWEFSNFEISGGTSFQGSFFSFPMSQDTAVLGLYKEICPWSLNVNPIFISNQSFARGIENPYSTIVYDFNNMPYENQKTKFKNNEIVQILISQPNYYIQDFQITGASLSQSTNTHDNYMFLNLEMTEDTYVDLIYKKFNKLTINSKNNITVGDGIIPTDEVTGQVKANFLSAILPSTQQTMLSSVITPSGFTSEDYKTIETFDDSFVNIVSYAWPPKNPLVKTITEMYPNAPMFVYFDTDGDGLNEQFYPQDEYPGNWTWTASTTGCTILNNTQENLSFFMTGDTQVDITWIFIPSAATWM
jgi:hypothetical protein